jgi:hypothetical protein
VLIRKLLEKNTRGSVGVITVTLATYPKERFSFDRRQLATVVASASDDTLIRLTDGRTLFVRESLVDVLASWHTDHQSSY